MTVLISIVPIARVAASVTVIDQAAMARTLSADVKELVRYEPGITVRNDPLRFGLDTFSVRGLGGNRVAVEVDGVPAAGVALRMETGYEGVDRGWHAAAIAATHAGPGDLLLGYVRREGHEGDPATDVQADPRDYSADSLILKYVLAVVSGGPLTLVAEGGQIGQKTAVDAFLGQPGRFVNTTQLEADDTAQRYRLSIEQSLRASRWYDGLDWRLYWQGTDISQDTFEIRRAVPPRTPPLQIDREFSFNESTFGLEATAVWTADRRRVTHDFVYGLEAARTRIEEVRNGLQTNLATGAATTTILGEVFPLRDLPVTDVTAIGVFAQDEISAHGSRWSVVPALRVDYYDLKPRADLTYLEDNPHSTAVGLREVSIAPKVGVTYRIGDSLGGFFQYAHGFRSPPPEDVNIGLELPLFNVRAIPNPDLKPEKSDGYEFGLRWRIAAVDLAGSVYYNDYRDFIESKVNLGIDPASHVTLFQSQNVSRASIYGAELSANLRADALWPSLAGWSGRVAAAWSRRE